MTAPAQGAVRGWALLRSTLLAGVCSIANLLPGGAAPALTPPSNLVPPTISGDALVGSVLTLSKGSWSGNPVPTITDRWLRDGLDTGQRGFTYTLTLADKDGTLSVEEDGSNSQGGPITVSSNSIGPITQPVVKPTNTSPPTLVGTGVIGEPINVNSGGTWDPQADSETFTWLASDSSSTPPVNPTVLVAAGGTVTFTPSGSSSSAGQYIFVEAIATANGVQSDPVYSAPIGPLTVAQQSSTLGGTGTLSAPELGYPTADNPPSVPVENLRADWQVGDVLKLAYSSNLDMSQATVLEHTLTEADATPGATISMGIPTLSGVTYFVAFGNDGTNDSQFLSNKVAWGDKTAPVFTSAASTTLPETAPLLWAFSFSDSDVASVEVHDGLDQAQFETFEQDGIWYARGLANKSWTTDKPVDAGFDNVYNVDFEATDYAGLSTIQAWSMTITAIDQTPDSFTFTDVTGAAFNTVYSSDPVTISGLEPGFEIAASVSGGSYSLNGANFLPEGSFTVKNGDTLSLQTTSGSTTSVSEKVIVTVGDPAAYTTTWSVVTPGSSATLTIGSGTTNAAPNRSHYITVADPGFSYSASNLGAAQFVKATSAAIHDDFYVELTADSLTATSGRAIMAIVEAALDLDGGGTGYLASFPGSSSTAPAGFSISAAVGSTTLRISANGSGVSVALPNGAVVAPGDVIGLQGVVSTNTLTVFYKSASGDPTQSGQVSVTTMTSLIPAEWYLAVGGYRAADEGTINFGATPYVMAKPDGADYYA